MKLVDNWRAVAFKTYSMWSLYLGLIALVGADALFALFAVEADPYPLGKAALVFFLVGMAGRLIRQDRQGLIARRILFLSAFGFGVVMLLQSLGGAVVEGRQLPDPAPAAAQEARAQIIPAMGSAPQPVQLSRVGVVPDAEFLAIAVPFIARWEGIELQAYRDIVGVWTVCYGETKGVRPGDRYTRAECDAKLARELITYRAGLHRYFTDQTKLLRLPKERDLAYVSLAYNAGIAGAGKSTAVRRLNAADIAGGCDALTWWNKAGGRVVRGLVRRRSDEYALCMIGVA